MRTNAYSTEDARSKIHRSGLLAIQLAPLLADNINAATGLLLSPGIEQKAKAFCEQLDAEKDGQ